MNEYKNRENKNKKLINNLIFYFYFYILRYLNILNLKYLNIKFIQKLNIYDNLKYLNIMNYKNNYILLNYNYLKLIKNKINKFDNILIEIIYKNKNYNRFSYNLFFEYKLNIYLMVDFYLQIKYIYFICYKNYLNYFKFFKYNEYLFNNKSLNKYSLLKKFIKIILKYNFYKENHNLNMDFVILNNVFIYSSSLEKIK
jgi:hypothetical protein